MALPIIQSMWGCYSDELLSNLELLAISSFCANGHDFHLYCYYDIPNLPNEIPGGGRLVVKDANEILPESEIFRSRNGSLAGFADWFRYELLLKRGGWWVDMDCVCIRPFDFDSDIVFATRSGELFNAVMACPPKHELCMALAHACRHYTAEQPWDTEQDRAEKEKARRRKLTRADLPYAIFGPRLLDKAVRHFGLLEYAKPYMTFVPIGSEHWHYIFDDSFAGGVDFPANTHCVHVWNSILGKGAVTKNAEFYRGSLFEQLKVKYRITQAPGADKINSDDLLRLAKHQTQQKDKKVADAKKRRRIRKNISQLVFVIVFVALTMCLWLEKSSEIQKNLAATTVLGSGIR